MCKRRCKHCPLSLCTPCKILVCECICMHVVRPHSANLSFYYSCCNKITTRVFTLQEAARRLFFSSLKTSYNTVFIEHPGGSMPLKYLASDRTSNKRGGWVEESATWRHTTAWEMLCLFSLSVTTISGKHKQTCSLLLQEVNFSLRGLEKYGFHLVCLCGNWCYLCKCTSSVPGFDKGP